MYACAFSLVPVISYCCIDDRYCAAEGVTSETMSSGGLRETGEPHYVLATGCNLTAAQKAEVDALVKKIRPFFLQKAFNSIIHYSHEQDKSVWISGTCLVYYDICNVIND